MKKKFGWNKFRTDLAIKETDPNFIRAHEKAQKFIKEHPNVPVVDVPPVDCGDPQNTFGPIEGHPPHSLLGPEQSDTVENVNNNRMLAGWGRYNYMECADKGSHDMRLAFIAGYKRALHDAQPQLCDPTADAELAELLNMLMATNVHGAVLQLRDHLDGDKRLIDNYRRLYKRAESASSSLLPVPDELEKFRTALTKINDIRNSLVGFQSFNFSEHAYPLVAALDEAGFEGMPYPEAMKHFGTMLERTLTAEARVKELESVASLPVGESPKDKLLNELEQMLEDRLPNMTDEEVKAAESACDAIIDRIRAGRSGLAPGEFPTCPSCNKIVRTSWDAHEDECSEPELGLGESREPLPDHVHKNPA